jgi:putative ABC transport system substrate-binding protein
MRRREFIAGLGSAAALASAAQGQQARMPVVGFLSARSRQDTVHLVTAFRRGLGEADYVEGNNVSIEYRWAEGQYDRLSAMALELVRQGVAVLATTGGEPAALAAKSATTTIPIVFAIGGDPLRSGLVGPKRLGLLHELVPKASALAALFNPANPNFPDQLREMEEAGQARGLRVEVLRASTDRDIEEAFGSVARQQIAALIVGGDPFFDTRREKLISLAARNAMPAMYHFREYAVAGGLMSYGVDVAEAYRQVGAYTGRILRGTRPADLPVLQPTRFEFVINLRTARALGLTVPNSMHLLADEVIE